MSVCIPSKIPSNLFRTLFHFVKSNEMGVTLRFQRILRPRSPKLKACCKLLFKVCISVLYHISLQKQALRVAELRANCVRNA